MNTIQLSGKFNIQTAPKARRQLMAKLITCESLSVDLSDMTVIDSTGVATLVEILLATHDAGRSLHLIGVGGQILQVLRLARLENLFSILTYSEGHTIH